MAGGNLRAAHRGYIYQDVVAAYALVEALIERLDRIVVDRKVVKDDRIDDLEVMVASRRVRRQIKSSLDPMRALTENDFTKADSTLRIDALVMSRVRAGQDAADEYRLCATWVPPSFGDDFTTYLRDVEADPTIPGTKTRTFRLNADAIWPTAESPKWPVAASLQRSDFVEFCERFVVELAMPQASLNLVAPGPLETALLDVITRRVGIGTYPNDGIRAVDFAAHAIFLATEARSRGAEYSSADIAGKLQVRTDFGHVAQAFPLDRAVEVPRAEARRELLETALAGGLQIVTGPPGAGKSWQLTQLARDLRAQGAVVARHYCYLDPADDQGALRITSDVFFGNVIYDLTREAPELQSSAHVGLAADFDALQRLLTAAGAYGQRVVLIVDGLDHIARVLADAPGIAAERSDIIDRLAALDIPDGVAIVIGSQPGEHLESLREQWGARILMRTLTPRSTDDLIALARAQGVEESLRSLGVEAREIETTLQRLAERADDNPLYARALSVELVTGCDCGDIGSPLAWLSSAEAVPGGIVKYYDHLYETVDRDGHVIADVLGVLDFAVTQTDLEQIAGPLYAAYVARALRVLRPVLIEASAQGGLRVFHESFRRFIREQLVKKSQTVASVLSPVITWLQDKGGFADARGFRFLLPALVRAGRDAEVRSYVDTAFVRTAVAAGFARDPILANTSLSPPRSRGATTIGACSSGASNCDGLPSQHSIPRRMHGRHILPAISTFLGTARLRSA